MFETHTITELVVRRLKGETPPKHVGQLSEAHNIAELVVRRIRGHATPKELEHLDEWASLSTDNRRWLQRFFDEEWLESRVRAYLEPDLDANFEKLCDRINDCRAKRQIRRARVRTLERVASAAIIIIIMSLTTYYFVKPPKATSQPTASRNPQTKNKMPGQSEEVKEISNKEMPGKGGYRIFETSSDDQKDAQSYNWYSTPQKGFMENEPLPDGSFYWLNSGSSIRFPKVFGPISRQVEVVGEAFFQVKADRLKPFWIIINNIAVKAGAGFFNINTYAEEGITRITAVKGTLYIDKDSILSGQCAEFMGEKLLRVIPADGAKVSAWTKRMFDFKNDSAAYVVNELARWYGLIVVCKDKECAQTLISYEGSRDDDVKKVIAGIMTQNPGKINLKVGDKNIELSR